MIVVSLFSLGKHPDVPPFPFDKIRQKFKFLSLLTFPEVISSIVSIKEECGRLSDMSLFHTGTGKPLKLEEFDQAQGQASMQVSYYIQVIESYDLCLHDGF